MSNLHKEIDADCSFSVLNQLCRLQRYSISSPSCMAHPMNS